MPKIAIVTGGGSGIGLRAVERLLSSGWKVWSLGINESQFVPPPCNADFYAFLQCDVSDSASVKTAFDKISRVENRIDALILSAGILRTGSLAEHSEDDVDRLLGTNVKGPWLCIREALPLLKHDSSLADPKRVVIVGSVSGVRPKVGSGFYAASKSAVHVLTGIFAVELASYGITVNAVAPGTIDTPMLQQASSSTSTTYKASGDSPLGRIGVPDDVVDVIFFYMSDAAKFVTGTVLPVDGGTRAAYVKS